MIFEYKNANKPPLGTHFSDGARVGPIFPAQYKSNGGGTPTLVETASINKSPGTQLCPWAVYDIAPQASSANSIVLSTTPTAAGYLTLAANGTQTTSVNKFSRSNVIQFDVPRTVSITYAGNGVAQSFYVFGYDMYGIRMVEEIQKGTAANTFPGVKAFQWVTAVYCSGGTGTPVTVGTSNLFGLPWRVDSPNYILYYWDGVPFSNVSFVSAYQGIGSGPNFEPTPTTLTSEDVRGVLVKNTTGNQPDGVRRLTAYAYILGANPLIDTTISSLPVYAGGTGIYARSVPDEASLNGYTQYWQDPFPGY